MALKDLKSDLSKFRRPAEKPLSDKKRVDVPKSSNKTPLSQFVDNAPTAAKSNTTTPKQGITPNKFDNSSKHLGETSPSKFDNTSNYLGETSQKQMSLEERFLGQTEKTEIQQGDKFKGETKTENITQGDRFKGQTTPQDYSNEEKFKGETTSKEFRFTQNFLGETTPTEFSLTDQFLGETTPTNFNLSERFLGETTPTEFNSEEKFLGETTPIEFNSEEKFLGETTPNGFTFNPNLGNQAKDPKFVDVITNTDARGFSPFQQPRNNSIFTGVDPSQTQFEGVTPLSGQFITNQYGVSQQNDSGIGKNYTNKVLKTTYNKFNLKEDSYNTSIFKQPFILSGIQREKGEPQTLGFGSFSFIRGGAVTSTARALIDVARVGQFLLTARGITWVAKQVGMQRSQKYGKIFTPGNMLASLGGQHLGLRFDRPDLIPLGKEGWKYNSSAIVDISPLKNMYNIFTLRTGIDVLPLRVDLNGGFDSFYGIGGTLTSRYTNTFDNSGTRYGNVTANIGLESRFSIGPTSPYDPNKKDNPVLFAKKRYESQITDSIRNNDGTKTTLAKQTQKASQIPIDKVFEERGLYKSEGKTTGFGNDIKDYEALSYGTIAKLADGDRSHNGDFRALKKTKYNIGQAEEATTNYTTDNFRTKYGFGQTFKTNLERISSDRLDTINRSYPGDAEQDDIVKLVFKTNSDNLCQFRGTVSGITETFSPSWNGEKPNGRADKMYVMTEFERTLSFSFKAVAYSQFELVPMWEKLKQLATFTMPYYGSGVGYRGRVLQFTLGDLWKNHTSLLTSLSYTMSDEASWETDKNYTIPKLVDISVGLTLVGDSIHSENSTKKLYDYGVG